MEAIRPTAATCPACRGTGRRAGGDCYNCGGDGFVTGWEPDDDCTCRIHHLASTNGDGYGAGTYRDSTGCPVHDDDLA